MRKNSLRAVRKINTRAVISNVKFFTSFQNLRSIAIPLNALSFFISSIETRRWTTFTSSIIFGKIVISFSTIFPKALPPIPSSHACPRIETSSTTTPRCADPHLSPRMTSPVVELLRRDKYTLGVGHEAFSNGRTKLPLLNNNHRRVSLPRIVRSERACCSIDANKQRNLVRPLKGMKRSIVSLFESRSWFTELSLNYCRRTLLWIGERWRIWKKVSVGGWKCCTWMGWKFGEGLMYGSVNLLIGVNFMSLLLLWERKCIDLKFKFFWSGAIVRDCSILQFF